MFASHFINNKKIYCYEIYEIKLILKNNWERKRIFTIIFYAIEKQNFELILRLSKLKQLNIIVHYKKFTRRYNFESSSFKLNNVKKILKILIQNASLYAMMITSSAFLHKKWKTRVNALRKRIDLIIGETLTILQKFVEF